MSNLMRILIALCCACTVSAVTQVLHCQGKTYTLVDGLVCPAGHEPISDKTLGDCKDEYCPSLNNWARAKGGTNMILRYQGAVCTTPPADAACQQQICQALPPTSAPPTSSPPTLVPPTSVPETDSPPTPQPGHWCPMYETDGSNTVLMDSCGTAACRASIFFPLNKAAQACDPCGPGLLPFALEVQRESGTSYTLTTIVAGTALAVKTSCGKCTALQGLTVAIPCAPAADASGVSSTVLILSIALGVLGGVLVTLGVGHFCRKRHSKQTPALFEEPRLVN